MPAMTKSYLNEDFPVTSFVYAIYCDVEYAQFVINEFKKDRKNRAPIGAYTSSKKRKFPAGASDLVYVTIPDSMGPADPGTYNPSATEAETMFRKYVMPELTYQAPANEAKPEKAATSSPAFENAERPLLSCLGQIFLNNDKAFDPGVAPGISDAVKDALKQVRRATNGRPFLETKVAERLEAAFVADVTKLPAMW